MLQWKDSQGLVFFMLNESESPRNNALNGIVHPFWEYLSNKLSSLYDPVNDKNYNPLKLNESWWRNSFKSDYKFESSLSSILKEIYLLNANYKTIQEILYQSNPNSLNPIIAYCKHSDTSIHSKSIHIKPKVEHFEDESGFVIFSDYFND